MYETLGLLGPGLLSTRMWVCGSQELAPQPLVAWDFTQYTLNQWFLTWGGMEL